jgi:hypothetical protein
MTDSVGNNTRINAGSRVAMSETGFLEGFTIVSIYFLIEYLESLPIC